MSAGEGFPLATDRAAHPRPDRCRLATVLLDGDWTFSFDEPTFDREIRVPFAYQCAASGIGSDEQHEVLWYRRWFDVPTRQPEERLLIHFGAVDFAATVWINGSEVGTHRGGHTSFTIDATAALALDDPLAPVELTVRAIDEFRSDQIRGKQTATFPFAAHYTPTSGIWLPVWAEVVGRCWVRELHVVAEADGRFVVGADLAGGTGHERLRVTFALEVSETAVTTGPGLQPVRGQLAAVTPWSPQRPALYDLTVEVLDADGTVVDRVESYAGFRTVTTQGDRWLLNGEPLRQRLVLDQGYWPSSLMTPPSTEAIAVDLDFVQQAGFDGVRKHQKLEDPRWLYEADRRGVLVWAEMPSPFGRARIGGQLAEDFRAEWEEAIRRDRNHPSVICWVPFNESWGLLGIYESTELQTFVRGAVAATRALDPSRPVIDNSGWCHVDTDVVDVHDYDQDPQRVRERWTNLAARGWDRGPFAFADAAPPFDIDTFRRYIGAHDEEPVDFKSLFPVVEVWAEGCMPPPGVELPIVVSEFGGIGWSLDEIERADHFAQGRAADQADLVARFGALIHAVEAAPGISGWCWTQLSDIEQEFNGLLTTDRRPKIEPDTVRAILDAAPWSHVASDTPVRR